jgi:hydroxymethylbilane synthase
MSVRSLVIGTRGSRLALWQADHIEARLKARGHHTEQRIIKTQGDRVRDLSFDKMEGKGFFTKEIESELLAGTIDLAVHSCKDLETRDPEGLHIAAIAGRAACEELLIIRTDAVDASQPLSLKQGAVVGTSSARRKSQLRMFRSDVAIADLRGNVPTRVEKLRKGEYDAILLAKAGIDRLELDLSEFQVRVLDPRWFVPAPAQGALAIQSRRDDARANEAAEDLHDDGAALCVGLERAVLFGYRGGCQVPLGVHAVRTVKGFSLWASAARTWEAMPMRIHLVGHDANALAGEAVERLQRTPRALRVLITREHRPEGLFARALVAHGVSVNGEQLLVAEALPFTLPAEFDRLFFTSRNAVRFFVRGGGDLNAARCDAIGSGTAEELRKHGGEVAYIGDGPDTPAIAAEYAVRFATQRVLFPCAEIGLRTVQKAMPEANVIDLPVYRMRSIQGISIPEADVVLVTSPEHANALHAAKPLGTFAHRIAMGTSTAQRIRELSGADAIIPWASNEMALVDAVFNIATA